MFEFKTIDPSLDRSICIEHRLDAYICTHGNSDGFLSQIGGEQGDEYISRLEKRISQIPQGNCLCYFNDQLAGQLEMKWHESPNVGYVNLFYLRPEYRGVGFGRMLHDKSIDIFHTLGADSLLLSVGKKNRKAKAFYEKLGWHNLGTRSDKPYAELYEFRI
ncbi:GNAT family N-acetyltransferase [Reinekea forsetii]|nr:GNAT family N-acetyltransferase [Reinekea forsetii]